MSEVSIVMSGHGRGEVFIDGEKVPNVKGIVFAAHVDDANEVTIWLNPDRLTYTGISDVTTISDTEPEIPVEWRLKYE